MYERLTQPATPDIDAGLPFRALCDGVLGAQVAYLIALGPLAPLVGPALVYPDDGIPPSAALSALKPAMNSPQIMCLPLDPQQYGGAVWAVPLWSERGLIGILLLGEKRDGGLYTQEEIEIARAAGERLIDTRASGEIARRLMALQRQKLQEGQLLDRRTRRVLHDDVLPRIHTAMLLLAGDQDRGDAAKSTNGEVVAILGDLHQQISNLLHALPTPDTLQVARVGLLGALHGIVGGELRYAFDTVSWEIEPEAEGAVGAIPALAAEVIVYAAREAVRNSARYGRNGDPNRPLHLTIRLAWQDGLVLAVEDDGAGIDVAEPSGAGSGQGLALHTTLMAVVGGTLTVESLPGAWTRVALALPRTAYEDMYGSL
jgi:signal transduction histidine kinase